jgi:hypothetical protein
VPYQSRPRAQAIGLRTRDRNDRPGIVFALVILSRVETFPGRETGDFGEGIGRRVTPGRRLSAAA